MKRKATSIILALSMILATIPHAFAGLVSEPQYGTDDVFTDGGFEIRTGDIWRVYYSPDTAYYSYVNKDSKPDYVKSGSYSMRFTNVGKSTGRGVYFYANGKSTDKAFPEYAAGVTYEFSGWFKTDAEGATLQILMPDGTSGQVEGVNSGGYVSLPKDEWVKLTCEWTAGGTLKNNFRFNTNLTTTIKGSDYDNNTTQIGEALDAAGQCYIYCDDISMKVVKKVWAEDAAIETSSGTTNGYARASYTYKGIEEEGESYVQWQINSEDKTTGWTNYKKVTKTSETDKDLTMIKLDSDCADKYLRAQIVPVNASGKAGQAVNTEAVKISAVTNIIHNGTFDWKLDGWSGDITIDNGEGKIAGTAEYDSGYTLTAGMGMNISFKAKGTGTAEVFLNDVSCGSVELTSDMTVYNLSKEISAAENLKIKIVAADATVDDIKLAPQAPTVYGVKIKGTPASNSTLTVEYTYDNSTDNNIKEGNTVIEWFIDNEKKGSGKTFKLPNTNGGNVYVAVTPVNANGVSGSKVTSETIEFYKLEASNLYITSDSGYKTNSVLIPHYTYSGTASEKESVLEWVIADSPDTPVSEWEPVHINGYANIGSTNRGTAKITASTAPTKAYAPLNHQFADKYVAFRLTPKDSEGREGVAVVSEATPVIEYVRNLAINGTVSNEMGLKEWDLRSSVEFSEENSTLPGTDDGTGSVLVNAESVKSGWETHPGGPAANSGGDALVTCPSFTIENGVTYNLSADAKWAYSHNVKMKMNMLLVSSEGYGMSATDVTTDWTKISVSFTGKAGSGASSYFSVRSWGLPDDPLVVKSGKFYIDNLEIYEVMPWVENVKVEGSAEVGNTLVASYDFKNTSELAEAKSVQEWLVSDNAWGPWTVYKTQTGTSASEMKLDITNELSNKYIKFRVTPSDRLGTLGRERVSTSEMFVSPTDDIEYSIALEDGTYTATGSFKNVQASDRTITAILVGYKAQSGSETVVDIAMDSHTVASGETCADFNLSVSSSDIENTKLYFVEGTGFDKVRPVDGLVSSYAKNAKLEKDSAVINQETKSTKVGLTSENPSQLAIVFVTKKGESLSGINKDNIKEKILYAGLARTGKDCGATLDFVLGSAVAGTEYTANIAFKNGVKSSVNFKFEGEAAASAIINAIKTASAEQVQKYLEGEKINGYDIRDVLFIDTTDFDNVTNKSVITSKIAGLDFTGKTGDIKTIVETESKKQYDYEVWDKNMTDFTNELKSCTASGLYDLMREYNDLFELKLDNKYGFSLSMNAQNKEAFMSEILTALKALIGTTNEVTSNNIKNNFYKIVALAAVNNGPWDKMGEILDEHWSTIGLGTYSGYAKADKTDMFKDIYNQTFKTLSDAKTYIDAAITELVKKPSGGSNGGGGGGGGGTTKPKEDDAITDRPVSVVDTNKRDDSLDDTESYTFSDLDGSHWAQEAIAKCAKEGILRGYDDNTYQPDNLVTRAEFASILLRTAGIEVSGEYDAVFADVTENDWFCNNVYAAKKAGIVNGTSNTEFSPNTFITREEMTTMVYRLCKSKLTKKTDISFSDFDDVSSWATEAVTALAGAEIINGTGDDLFEPQASVTRAMAAQIASRLMGLY